MSDLECPHTDETSDEFEEDALSDDDLETVAGGWSGDDGNNGGGG